MERIGYFNDKQIEYPDYLIKELLKKKYIIDTSFVSKLFYKENEEDIYNASFLYNKLKSEKCILFAPDLLMYELLNVLRTRSEIKDEKVSEILTELYNFLIILGINKNLLLKSFSISRKLNISIYDSIFLALTIDLDASLITADKKLYEANKNSNYRLILLSDFVKENSYWNYQDFLIDFVKNC